MRQVTAALAIIRAHLERDYLSGQTPTESVFLVQRSATWGGYWFPGGIAEVQDCGDHQRTLLRELEEELALTKADILELSYLFGIKDQYWSQRVKVMTQYQYEVFSVRLGSESTKVKTLLRHEFELRSLEGSSGHKRLRTPYRWCTWSELVEDRGLQRYGRSILKSLDRLGLERIPLSLDEPVHV